MADQNLRMKLTAIDRTQKAFRAVKTGLRSVTKALFSFKTALISVAGAAGIGLLVKSSLDGIDRISKLSRTLGIAVGDLRKLELAAELSGVELETLSRGVRTLNRGAVEFVQKGSGLAKDAFDQLGISADELGGVMGDQFKVLELVADRLQDVENSAVRSSIAQDLFGGRASELLLVLEEGAEGLARISAEAKDFGLVLSTATARNVEDANDSFTRLKSLFKGLRDTLVGALAPAFRLLADRIRNDVLESIKEAGGIEAFGKKLAITVLDIFEKAFRGIISFTNAVGRQFNNLLDFIRDVSKALDIEFTDKLEQLRFVEFKDISTIFSDLKKQVAETGAEIENIGQTQQETAAEIKSILGDLDKAYQDVAERGLKSLEDTLVDIANQTRSVKDAFKDMARSILSDLVRIGIRRSIIEPLSGAFFGPTPAPGRAIGGPVQMGKAYTVGERGPEMFVPSRSGSIIPNDRLSSGGAVINQTINISTGVSQTVRAEVQSLLPQIAEASKAAVLDARRRGGSFSAAFG